MTPHLSAARRILYVWDADYPWDIRTQKICRSLTDFGWSVAIAARNTRNEQEDEMLPEGRVLRMPRFHGVLSRFGTASSFPAFFNPRWVRHIRRAAAVHQPDVIVVRDLPLAPTASWVGSFLRLPVVLDMAENYPAMIRDIWTSGRARPADVLIRNPWLVRLVERWAVPRMDRVITVIEESSERLLADGIPAERLAVVSNTPSRERALVPRQLRGDATLRAAYLGLMEIPRGILDVLDATATLVRRGFACEVDLVGDGRDFSLVKARAERLGLRPPTLRIHGRLPNAEALQVVARAEVGLVPHHAVESWNTTIPNKLFDYMAASLAVVSSDAVPARRIVETTGCGEVYRSGDAEALAEALATMVDPQYRQACADRGRAAVAARYNWDNDFSALVDVLQAASCGRGLRS